MRQVLIGNMCKIYSWEIDVDEHQAGAVGGGSEDSGFAVINHATQWAMVSLLKGESQEF